MGGRKAFGSYMGVSLNREKSVLEIELKSLPFGLGITKTTWK